MPQNSSAGYRRSWKASRTKFTSQVGPIKSITTVHQNFIINFEKIRIYWAETKETDRMFNTRETEGSNKNWTLFNIMRTKLIEHLIAKENH